MKEYAKHTRQLLKYKEWLKSDLADLALINRGRTPNGMKPFKVGEIEIMWDHISNADDIELKFVIPKGATFRERMKTWHQKHQEASKACRVEMN